MAGRGAQTFKKRQKEQQRKEKQQEKLAKRADRKPQTLEETTQEMQVMAESPTPQDDYYPDLPGL